MANHDTFATSPTLLRRLADGPSDQAWEQFVHRYAPAVYAWAWQTGLQESDAADVTQEVMLKLVQKIRTFRYDKSRGSFRGWLKTVTIHAARDCGRKLARRHRESGHLSSIGDASAWDDLGQRIEKEYLCDLVSQAELIVQQRVQPRTWTVYELIVREDLCAADAAARVGVTVAEAYVAKSRVLKQLRETVAELERIDNGGG